MTATPEHADIAQRSAVAADETPVRAAIEAVAAGLADAVAADFIEHARRLTDNCTRSGCLANVASVTGAAVESIIAIVAGAAIVTLVVAAAVLIDGAARATPFRVTGPTRSTVRSGRTCANLGGDATEASGYPLAADLPGPAVVCPRTAANLNADLPEFGRATTLIGFALQRAAARTSDADVAL